MMQHSQPMGAPEGGCSTPEKPVKPLLRDQLLGRLVVICAAHNDTTGGPVPVEIETQEQMDSFCSNCPLNLKAPLGDSTPPPFL